MSKLNKILVFHIGHLGDTLMIVPSLWALRKAFPKASFVLLTDKIAGDGYVPAADVFKGSDFFEKIMTFKKSKSGCKLLHFSSMAMLWPNMVSRRFDAVAYLVPSARHLGQIRRDKAYFRSAGINNLIGFKGFERQKNLTDSRHESLRILHRLALDGITCNDASFDLQLGVAEKIKVDHWLLTNSLPTENRLYVAFAPGSKMQAKRWPIDRFAELGEKMSADLNILPVIVGGVEDYEIGEQLIARWKIGINVAGNFSVRESAELLKRCALYIGNDTGTMHLAAAVGTPCLALFSARDLPGKWFPYGENHTALRITIECQGCMLSDCSHQSCLMMISVDEAYEAATRMFQKMRGHYAAS